MRNTVTTVVLIVWGLALAHSYMLKGQIKSWSRTQEVPREYRMGNFLSLVLGWGYLSLTTYIFTLSWVW